jgi:hypothetical protein
MIWAFPLAMIVGAAALTLVLFGHAVQVLVAYISGSDIRADRAPWFEHPSSRRHRTRHRHN